MNGANAVSETTAIDAMAARHHAAGHQRHNRYTQSRLDHADDYLSVRCLHVHARRQAAHFRVKITTLHFGRLM